MIENPPFGPQFQVGEHETLADGKTTIYSVRGYGLAPKVEEQEAFYAEMGFAAPKPTVRYLGHIWENAGYGWVAAPPRLDDREDSWHDEVTRSVRYFASPRDACMYLWGHIEGVGAVRLAEKLATMPWARGRTSG